RIVQATNRALDDRFRHALDHLWAQATTRAQQLHLTDGEAACFSDSALGGENRQGGIDRWRTGGGAATGACCLTRAARCTFLLCHDVPRRNRFEPTDAGLVAVSTPGA